MARNGGKASQGKIVCFFVLVRGHVFVRVLADIGIFFFENKLYGLLPRKMRLNQLIPKTSDK